MADHLDYLINHHGRLASYVYQYSCRKEHKPQINYESIKAIGKISPEKSRNILEIAFFLEHNSSLLQTDVLSLMFSNLANKKYVYWFVYPNFYSILSRLIAILANTDNSIIKANLSTLLSKLILFIVSN
jgi:hypothetical protein